MYELLAQIPFSSLTIYLFVYLLSRVIQRSSVLGTLRNIHFDLRKILNLCHCNLWKCRLLPLFPSHFRLPFIARLFQPACKTQTQELRLQVYKLSSSKKISRHVLTIIRSGSELEFRRKEFSIWTSPHVGLGTGKVPYPIPRAPSAPKNFLQRNLLWSMNFSPFIT